MYGDNKAAFRCKGCGKLLAKTDGDTTIVCPRCGGVNSLTVETMKIRFVSKSDRNTSSGHAFR